MMIASLARGESRAAESPPFTVVVLCLLSVHQSRGYLVRDF
jgi:hypothetical protein